jgi:hypothetical protein
MKIPPELNIPVMSKAATYRIVVHGQLDASKSSFLEGMTIKKDTVCSTLCGRLSDQAALMGVVSTLYDWHLPIISVECTDVDNKNDSEGMAVVDIQ